MNNEPDSIDLESIHSLAPKAKDGDPIAREEICRQVQGYLEMMATRHLDKKLGRRINPSDIVQRTMMRVVDGLDGFRGQSNEEFYGWLNAIMRNELNKVRRDNQREKRDVNREQHLTNNSQMAQPAVHDPALTPSSEAMRGELLDSFHATLKRLPPDYAEVIRLRSLEERPFKEVAERMQRSVDSVTKLWYRAMVKFQMEMESHQDQP